MYICISLPRSSLSLSSYPSVSISLYVISTVFHFTAKIKRLTALHRISRQNAEFYTTEQHSNAKKQHFLTSSLQKIKEKKNGCRQTKNVGQFIFERIEIKRSPWKLSFCFRDFVSQKYLFAEFLSNEYSFASNRKNQAKDVLDLK